MLKEPVQRSVRTLWGQRYSKWDCLVTNQQSDEVILIGFVYPRRSIYTVHCHLKPFSTRFSQENVYMFRCSTMGYWTSSWLWYRGIKRKKLKVVEEYFCFINQPYKYLKNHSALNLTISANLSSSTFGRHTVKTSYTSSFFAKIPPEGWRTKFISDTWGWTFGKR